MSKKAVIVSGGHQYIVSEGDKIQVELVDSSDKILFEPLLVIDGDKITVGQPNVKNVKVEAKVVDQLKGSKVVSIRYKAKKRVNKKRGHRQNYNLIEITKIG